MMYKCKILTDDFLAKVDAYINNITKDIKDEEEKRKKEARILFNLRFMWNNPLSFVDQPVLIKQFQELGIYEPQYTEMPFLSRGIGAHMRPKIAWMQGIQPIDNIREIFSYELMK